MFVRKIVQEHQVIILQTIQDAENSKFPNEPQIKEKMKKCFRLIDSRADQYLQEQITVPHGKEFLHPGHVTERAGSSGE